jgi:hypothetical protein
MRRITRLVIACAIVMATLAPAASAAERPTGGLPFKPPPQGGLPFTGISLGGIALIGALMVAGGLLVRRAAAVRAD